MYITAFYFGKLCYKCFYLMCLTVAGRSMNNNIYLCDHRRLVTHDCICYLKLVLLFCQLKSPKLFPLLRFWNTCFPKEFSDGSK